MKKRIIRCCIGITLFIGLSNIVPLYPIFRLVGDGVLVEPLEIDYITKDRSYVYTGGWLKDTLKDPYYKRYLLLHPHADRILYRVRPIEAWRFWRWRDYLTEERWRQPYLKVDVDSVWRIFKNFSTIYEPYEGSLPPLTHKDLLSAHTHLKPIGKNTLNKP